MQMERGRPAIRCIRYFGPPRQVIAEPGWRTRRPAAVWWVGGVLPYWSDRQVWSMMAVVLFPSDWGVIPMRSFLCQCGATLFFHSTHCLTCGRSTMLCPGCRSVSAVETRNGAAVCQNCGAAVRRCRNRSEHEICNGAVPADSNRSLCRFCGFNRVIPDLSVAENLARWRRIEQAKRRVLFDVERIGLPIVSDADDPRPSLVFEFKSAGVAPVSTGHLSGVITMDLAEADSVHREKSRVEFGEPQRTLVGHFRHELGHYFWEVCVRPDRLEACRELFGDERDPTYAQAQKRYYDSGPLPNWRDSYVSAYATMHPWEDFAETFNAYLDMIAVVGTANHYDRLHAETDDRDFKNLMDAYREIGVAANELNRDMGLLDLVPEVFTQPVRDKLRFVHELRC